MRLVAALCVAALAALVAAAAAASRSATPMEPIVRIGATTFGPVGEGPERVGNHSPPHYVALSPEGGRLFTLDDDFFLRAWDVERRKLLWRISVGPDDAPPARQRRSLPTSAFRGLVGGVAASPDGRTIAACSWGSIRIVEAATGRQIRERPADPSMAWNVRLVWSCDSRRLLWGTGGPGGDELGSGVVQWEVETDVETRSGEISRLRGIHPMPDGDVAVAIAKDRGWTAVLDGETLAFRSEPVPLPRDWVLEGWSAPEDPRMLVWLPGERGGIAWYDPRSRRLESWTRLTGLCRIVCDGPVRDLPSAVADERGLITSIRDDETGDTIIAPDPELRLLADDAASFAVGEHLVAIGCADGSTRLLSRPDGRELMRLRSADGRVVRALFLPGERRLVAGHEGGTILVWDLGRLRPAAR